MAKKILIIDDDMEVQEMLGEFLSEKGFTVTSAPDGDSGLAIITKDPPDLVLVDLLMPRKDGLAFCRTLRQDSAHSHIPIMLMTGVYRDLDFHVYLQKMLADEYITKPIQLDQLMVKISRLL